MRHFRAAAALPPASIVPSPYAGLSEEMYDDGFLNIINIDISKTAIRTMAARTADRKTMRWEVMSCTALTLSDASVDAVLDKGTMDSLLCGENSAWGATGNSDIVGVCTCSFPLRDQALPTWLKCVTRCRGSCAPEGTSSLSRMGHLRIGSATSKMTPSSGG